jgi:GTP-binding protein EngB required for normal cell division
VVLTKLDKLASTRQKSVVDQARRRLAAAGLGATALVGFSAVSGLGRERVWRILMHLDGVRRVPMQHASACADGEKV